MKMESCGLFIQKGVIQATCSVELHISLPTMLSKTQAGLSLSGQQLNGFIISAFLANGSFLNACSVFSVSQNFKTYIYDGVVSLVIDFYIHHNSRKCKQY